MKYNSDNYNKIGNSYHKKGQRKKALAYFQKALRMDPNYYPAYNNIGMLLNEIGDFSNAMEYLKQAIDLKPDSVTHLYNLAHTFESIGKIDQAIQYLERIIQLQPNFQRAYSTLLMQLNYTFTSVQKIYQAHVKWGQKVESEIAPVFNQYSDRTFNKILRIGYLSPDLHNHSIVFFFEPVLKHHNNQYMYTVCYNDAVKNDKYTKRLKSYANLWRECHQMDDESLARLIQTDKIDILVDLAGHTVNNRLLVFAKKTAPIQVSYLGYVSTTGLRRMDYRIVDYQTDPADCTNPHTEKLFRLPNTFLCYQPPDDSPSVVNAPLIKNGYVTFGSFNAIKKTNDYTILLWSRILHAVPSSRLYIKSKAFNDKPTQERFRSKFQANGIRSDRLILNGYQLSNLDHLAQYHFVDIGLDTFPYNGTTTTCEALWMGVPVITMTGDRHAGRVGASLLQTIGLKDAVAHNEKDFIHKAVTIAQNKSLIIQLRKNLRTILINSTLCNAQEFTQSLEKAYHDMWHHYCQMKHA
jgi:predicted O-linked N-acetylglucosamine transferase (SPINDLY family)